MPYLRVVKGAVNFIVMFLSFGVDSRDVCSPGLFSVSEILARNLALASDEIPATKVRRVRQGTRHWEGTVPGQRPLSGAFSPLWVLPPSSNRSIHLIFPRAKYKVLPSALGQPEKEVHFSQILDASQYFHPFLFSLTCASERLFHKICHIWRTS